MSLVPLAVQIFPQEISLLRFLQDLTLDEEHKQVDTG